MEEESESLEKMRKEGRGEIDACGTAKVQAERERESAGSWIYKEKNWDKEKMRRNSNM